MTRINCLPVGELHNKHLLAEYRELPRVFGLVERYQARGGDPAQLRLHGQPAEYVLGKGHVKFFYTRLLWLSKRHQSLVNEMCLRGFKPTYGEELSFDRFNIDQHWWGDWEPTVEAMAINRARINDRLAEMKQ